MQRESEQQQKPSTRSPPGVERRRGTPPPRPRVPRRCGCPGNGPRDAARNRKAATPLTTGSMRQLWRSSWSVCSRNSWRSRSSPPSRSLQGTQAEHDARDEAPARRDTEAKHSSEREQKHNAGATTTKRCEHQEYDSEQRRCGVGTASPAHQGLGPLPLRHTYLISCRGPRRSRSCTASRTFCRSQWPVACRPCPHTPSTTRCLSGCSSAPPTTSRRSLTRSSRPASSRSTVRASVAGGSPRSAGPRGSACTRSATTWRPC